MPKWNSVAGRLCRVRGPASCVALALALIACAPNAPTVPKREAPASAPAAPAVAQSRIAELVTLAPFKAFLMTAEDAAGAYYSVTAKASFTIAADGSLALIENGGEPTIGASSDVSTDLECTAHGGGYNQRTAWFPYAAIFVHGGSIEKVTSAGGDARRQRALSIDTDGSVVHTGPGARNPEYSFVPCVGAQRVDPGVRLDTYLAADDRLMLRSAGGQRLRLRLPQPFAPYVLARYEEGAMIPVPMRIVVASVDLGARRVVLQLQTTLAMSPSIRKLELRAALKDGAPGEGESREQYRQRAQALLADLAACAPPVAHAIEPCANASRRPDPRIFVAMP
jgi:hypothetical protein